MSILKAYVVGYGYMGQIRAQVCINDPRIELVGVCDSSIQEEISGVEWFEDYEEGLSACKPDLVFICTPNFLIPDYAETALLKGSHVFCEKPPGKNVADILKIQKAEKASDGKKVIFGFNHRYHPAMQDASGIVESKELGDILYIRSQYGKSCGRGNGYVDSWRNDKEVSGGGILLDQGIHMLDLVRLYLGDIEDVQGIITTNYWDIEVEDNAMVHFRSGKVIGSLHSCATLWRHGLEMEIGLEKGVLKISGFLSQSGSYGRETLTISRKFREGEEYKDAVGFPTEEVRYYDQDNSWTVQVDYWMDCILNDKAIEKSGTSDALKVMKIIETVYQQNGVNR